MISISEEDTKEVKMAKIQYEFRMLRDIIKKTCRDCRERYIALEKLDESSMWVTAAGLKDDGIE
jgi:hypothetical protein